MALSKSQLAKLDYSDPYSLFLVSEAAGVTPKQASMLYNTMLHSSARMMEARQAANESSPDSEKPWPTPAPWINPATIPRRQWLYGGHYVRKYASATISAGGVGKSALAMAEGLSMVTARPFLGHMPPKGGCRVWYFNGEDPIEETTRRYMAICLRYGLKPEELDGRWFADSGRETPLIMAQQDRSGIKVMTPVIEKVKRAIVDKGIDVLIIDPFVKSHRVPENDNGAIDAVATEWAHIADETNTSIELVHHVKKTDGREITVEDARGASALIGAVRSARVINRMTSKQAEDARVPESERRSYFCISDGKTNMRADTNRLEWRRIESVPLGNGGKSVKGRNIPAPQDHVGVVVEWRWPSSEDLGASAVADVTDEQLQDITASITKQCQDRYQPQSKQWAGHAIGLVLGIETDAPAGRKQVREMLEHWIKAGYFAVENRKDAIERKSFDYVVLGPTQLRN